MDPRSSRLVELGQPIPKRDSPAVFNVLADDERHVPLLSLVICTSRALRGRLDERGRARPTAVEADGRVKYTEQAYALGQSEALRVRDRKLVRPALSNLHEAESQQDGHDLPQFQNRDVAHSSHSHGLRPDELGLEDWLTVLQQHRDHLFEVPAELILRRALRVRALPPRDVANVKPRVLVALDDSGKRAHGENIARVSERRRRLDPPCDDRRPTSACSWRPPWPWSLRAQMRASPARAAVLLARTSWQDFSVVGAAEARYVGRVSILRADCIDEADHSQR